MTVARAQAVSPTRGESLFDALGSRPDAQLAPSIIRDVHRVEHEAKERGIARTPEHRAMRRARSKPLLDELHSWLVEKKDTFLPK